MIKNLKKHCISTSIALLLGISASTIHINVYANSSINNPVEYIIKDNKKLNKVNINAKAEKEFEKNFASITLSFNTQGNSSKEVQKVVINEINKATSIAKQSINKNPNIKVITNNLNIYPVYQKQKLVNWNGSGSIIIEGKDIPLVSEVASKINNMVISNTNLRLSDDMYSKYKDEIKKEAIENFKKEASFITTNFGFKDYDIEEVNIHFDENYPILRTNQFMKASAVSMESNDAPVIDFSVSNSKITAQINGSIYMK